MRLQRVQAVAENQRKGHNEQPDDFARTKRVFAENLEHIGKQRDAGAERDEAHEIERWGLFLAIVGQMEIDHQQPGYADGNVYEENVSPIEIAKDYAAEQGPEHRPDQRGDGDKTHDADQLGFRERPHQRQAAYGNHHRAAATLQKPAGNQQVNVARNSTEKGTQGEKADSGREDVARAETVGHPSADGNKHSKAKRVAGEHRLHTERSHVQSFGDSRDSRVENRGIE